MENMVLFIMGSSETRCVGIVFFLRNSNFLDYFLYNLDVQEVAIKRMTAMKTKEFIAEMKVLCKVHHSSLVEDKAARHYIFYFFIPQSIGFYFCNLFIFILINFNKVELTGYAATNDELFLIYEYAHKGSLKNHLHDPQNKGIVSFDKVVLVHR